MTSSLNSKEGKESEPTQYLSYTLGKSPLISITNLAEEFSWNKKIQILVNPIYFEIQTWESSRYLFD